jgi:hypothetical protein
MIRLTVFYNLPEGTDEDEFLKWRLGEHRRNNESMPGVIRTDFAKIYEGYPRHETPKHRFMTIAEFPDKETLEKAFWNPDGEEDFQESLKRITDYVFYISEVYD